MKRSLQFLADAIGAELVGAPEREVSGVASVQSASSQDLVFAEDAQTLALALQSLAAAVITGNFAARDDKRKPLLVARQPKLAFARAAALIHPATRLAPGVHPAAVVHPSATLGAGVHVGAHSVIDENAVIGENTQIGAGCVIGAGVTIGADCDIKPNVTVYPGTRLGRRVIVHAGAVLGSDGFGYVRDESTGEHEKFPQIGRLDIADDVEIGANASIDRGALDATVIGRGVKIDNMVHVGHNVRIGDRVVIAAQTGISGSVVIENDVLIGGQVGLADHVRIEEGAMLGSQCGVPTSKVIRGKGVVFWGTPARPIKQYLKELAVLARLAKK